MDNTEIQVHDLQTGEYLILESKTELKNWIDKKIQSMVITLILGVILCIVLIMELDFEFGGSLMFFFIPYMIRKTRHSLLALKIESEIVKWLICSIPIYLASATFVYPIILVAREIIEYRNLKNNFLNI